MKAVRSSHGMKPTMGNILRFIRTDAFFKVIIGLFILQAAWLAISNTYPSLIDESYHLGIIQQYSNSLSPILSTQPPGSSELGDITRYGSYFYHFLMSFPYRVLDWVGVHHFIIVVLLRFINIAIFVLTIVAFRKVLKRLQFGPAVINMSMLIVTLLPSFILLGATVNYDSLFILFAVMHLYFFVALLKTEFLLKNFIGLLLTGTLGSITKYTFLPIIVTTGLVTAVIIIRYRSKLIARMKEGPRQISWRLAGLGVLALLSTGLFIERYGGNIIQYSSVQPDCSRLHSIEFCKKWPPWGRNLKLDAAYPDQPSSLAGASKFFVEDWWRSIVKSTTLAGKSTTGGLIYGSPLALGTLTFLSCIGMFFYIITSFTKKYRRFWALHLIALVYVFFLFMSNFVDYLQMGRIIGVQARYLFWILPIIIALALTGIRAFIGASFKRTDRIELVGYVVLLGILSQYAGLMTYGLTYGRQQETSKTTITKPINATLSKVAKKIVIGE